MTYHTLFTVGTKRSGTSLFSRLINQHPQIYITHESDLIWILYQHQQNQIPQPYAYDIPGGMNATLEKIQPLKPNSSIPELFYENTLKLLTYGSTIQNTYNKIQPPKNPQDIKYLGDKKPVQHSDPQIRKFIQTQENLFKLISPLPKLSI